MRRAVALAVAVVVAVVVRVATAALALLLAQPSAAGVDPGDHEHLVAEQLRADPTNAALHLRRGTLLLDLGSIDEARAALARARSLDAHLPGLDLATARLLAAQGELAAARTLLSHALTHAPDDVAALRLAARVDAARGALEAADRSYRRLLDLCVEPEPELVHEWASAVAPASRDRAERSEAPAALRSAAPLAPRGAGDPVRALEVVDAALARWGAIPSLEILAIDLEERRGELGRAVERIDALLAGHGSLARPTWLHRRATLLGRLGRVDEARATRADARDALALLPERVRSSRRFRALAQELARAAPAASEHPSPATSPVSD